MVPDFVGYSRASYFRAKRILKELALGRVPPSKRPHKLNKPKWGEKENQLVLRIHRENETFGKYKIYKILQRDHGCSISESTVGRILTHLRQKGLIIKSPSASHRKRKINFNNQHAKAWTYKDYKTMKLGERVQINHMGVCKNGIRVKHFQSWEWHSKHIHAHAYSNATVRSAKHFLQELLEITPYPILSIQVDGAVSSELKKAVEKYNTYRPHFALQGLTPIEYILSNHQEVAA